MIRAQHIRFTKDDAPMAPGRSSAPITTAHVPLDPKNPGQGREHERMDEILVYERHVRLRGTRRDPSGRMCRYTRFVSMTRVIDWEPMPGEEDDEDQPAKGGKDAKR